MRIGKKSYELTPGFRKFILTACLIVLYQIILFAQSTSSIRQLEILSGGTITDSRTESYTTYTSPNYNQQYSSFITDLGYDLSQKAAESYKSGKYGKAFRIYRQASKYLPDNSTIKNNLEEAKRMRDAGKIKSKPPMAASVLDKDINQLENMIKSDLLAIRRIGYDKTVEEFEAWDKLNEGLKNDLEAQLMAFFFDQLSLKADALGDFDKQKAKKFVRDRIKAGKTVPDIVTEYIGAINKNQKNAKIASTLYSDMSKYLTTMALSDQLNKKQWLDMSAEFLKMTLKNPNSKFIVSSAETFVSLFYTIGVQQLEVRDMDNMTQRTEQQLKDLKKISDNLKRNMQKLENKKEERAKI